MAHLRFLVGARVPAEGREAVTRCDAGEAGSGREEPQRALTAPAARPERPPRSACPGDTSGSIAQTGKLRPGRPTTPGEAAALPGTRRGAGLEGRGPGSASPSARGAG